MRPSAGFPASPRSPGELRRPGGPPVPAPRARNAARVIGGSRARSTDGVRHDGGSRPRPWTAEDAGSPAARVSGPARPVWGGPPAAPGTRRRAGHRRRDRPLPDRPPRSGRSPARRPAGTGAATGHNRDRARSRRRAARSTWRRARCAARSRLTMRCSSASRRRARIRSSLSSWSTWGGAIQEPYIAASFRSRVVTVRRRRATYADARAAASAGRWSPGR